MRTTVYVDGFNLYNRRLKKLPQYKWLNLKALADNVLSAQFVVQKVNLYTAPARQQALLSALDTVPEIEIHYGNFSYWPRWGALVQPPQAKPPGYVWPNPLPDLVLVEKAEEKGSDVNLASHLVRDAFTNQFDAAAVITNDTDLIEPIRIAVQEAKKVVGLLSPVVPTKGRNGKWVAAHPTLKTAASFTVHIHNSHLAASLFPQTIPGTQIVRPAAWV